MATGVAGQARRGHASTRWSLPLALLVLAGLSAWAILRSPHRTLLQRMPAVDGSSVSLPAELSDASRWWRFELNLDRQLAPVPAWSLSAGEDQGDGYELRWQPDSGSFHLLRLRPMGILHLGAVTPDGTPLQIELHRREDQLLLELDGRVALRCFDAQPAPGSRRWLLRAEDLGSSRFDLHHDAHLQANAPSQEQGVDLDDLDGDDLVEPQASLVLRRIAIQALADSDPAALARARRSILALRSDDARLSRDALAWLAWARALRAIDASGDAAPPDLLAAIRDLGSSSGPPAAGLALDLCARLSARAAVRPSGSMPPRQWLAGRATWLRKLVSVGEILLAQQHETWRGLPPHSLFELDLALHAARSLLGDPAQEALPKAPAWLTARWRLAAGLSPEKDQLPDLPEAWHPGCPLRAPLHALLREAGQNRPAALAASNAIRRALAADEADTARGLAEQAPRRERALLLGLLGAAGLVRPSRAREALRDEGLEGSDPLAQALAQLIAHRHPDPDEAPPAPAQPTWTRLLAGNAGATLLVFAPEAGNLRPLEAAAAAMAMQEIAGLAPDWALLDTYREPVLPLEILARPPATPAPTTPAGSTDGPAPDAEP